MKNSVELLQVAKLQSESLKKRVRSPQSQRLVYQEFPKHEELKNLLDFSSISSIKTVKMEKSFKKQKYDYKLNMEEEIEEMRRKRMQIESKELKMQSQLQNNQLKIVENKQTQFKQYLQRQIGKENFQKLLTAIKKISLKAIVRQVKIINFMRRLEVKSNKQKCRLVLNSWKYFLKQQNDKKAMLQYVKKRIIQKRTTNKNQ